MLTTSLSDTACQLQNLCVSRATGGGDDSAYEQLRRDLISCPTARNLVPSFIRNCRDPFQFWQHIKHRFPTYQERRTYIWDEFRPLIERLEASGTVPSDSLISGALPSLDSGYVQEVWSRALDRRSSDPDGAITLARTLLESVCKLILDDIQKPYDENACDLPKLYKMTADALN